MDCEMFTLMGCRDPGKAAPNSMTEIRPPLAHAFGPLDRIASF